MVRTHQGKAGMLFRERLVVAMVIGCGRARQAGPPTGGGDQPSSHSSESERKAVSAEEKHKGRETMKEVSNNP